MFPVTLGFLEVPELRGHQPVCQDDEWVVVGILCCPHLIFLQSEQPPLTSFYTLKFYSSFLGKSSNLSLSVMFLFHRGQLSPREIKQLDQGHPISGRDGTKVSFLMTLIIIWLSRDKCHFPYPDDLKHIWLLNSGRGKLKVGQWVWALNPSAKTAECQLRKVHLKSRQHPVEKLTQVWVLDDSTPHWQRRGPNPKQRPIGQSLGAF